jgi:hypothetical protein
MKKGPKKGKRPGVPTIVPSVGDFILFFDYETTGFSPARDKPIELAWGIAWLKEEGAEMIKKGGSLIKPATVSSKITGITSITQRMVNTEGCLYKAVINDLRKDVMKAVHGHPHAKVFFLGFNSDVFDLHWMSHLCGSQDCWHLLCNEMQIGGTIDLMTFTKRHKVICYC